MNIEIDEDYIQEQFQIMAKQISKNVIQATVNGWNFEDKIKKIVRDIMDEAINEVIASELANCQEIKSTVKEQMVKRIKAKLERAMREEL